MSMPSSIEQSLFPSDLKCSSDWAARYNTWLLIEIDAVRRRLFFSVLVACISKTCCVQNARPSSASFGDNALH